MDLKDRITKIISHLLDGLYERNEHVAVLLLAALCGQNAFLLGPPGTAKSMLARRLAAAFQHDNNELRESFYFEYLMNRFSTPEDVFGPVSIKALKDDRYERKTEGFLPSAHFAFLDEIWKSSPAILNALLTIINEKKFHNGGKPVDVPLKSLIAASNETPQEGQGLEALYDRFIVRLHAAPLSNEHFDSFLKGASQQLPELPDNLIIKQAELQQWRAGIEQVALSGETLSIIGKIRYALEEDKECDVYVSDRRWLNATRFIKASAFFCGRTETSLSDVLLLRHCLWTSEENRERVIDIVEGVVQTCGFATETDLATTIGRKNALEAEITKELYHDKDEYDSENIRGEECFSAKVVINHGDMMLFIPVEKIRKKASCTPCDQHGNPLEHFQCDFNGTGTCKITSRHYRVRLPADRQWRDAVSVTPKKVIAKGTYREDAIETLLEALDHKADNLTEAFTKIGAEVQSRREAFEKQTASPFLSENARALPFDGIEKQQGEIKQQILDCERLRKKIRGEA